MYDQDEDWLPSQETAESWSLSRKSSSLLKLPQPLCTGIGAQLYSRATARTYTDGKIKEEEEFTVSCCFKPTQPKKITLGLRETFTKRYVVEKTTKTKVRPKEQSEKADSYRENLWNEIQLKGP